MRHAQHELVLDAPADVLLRERLRRRRRTGRATRGHLLGEWKGERPRIAPRELAVELLRASGGAVSYAHGREQHRTRVAVRARPRRDRVLEEGVRAAVVRARDDPPAQL